MLFECTVEPAVVPIVMILCAYLFAVADIVTYESDSGDQNDERGPVLP